MQIITVSHIEIDSQHKAYDYKHLFEENSWVTIIHTQPHMYVCTSISLSAGLKTLTITLWWDTISLCTRLNENDVEE